MAKGRYRTTPYWEKEKPVEAKTGKLWVSYYPQAGKLQLASYIVRDGREIRTRVVTLDQEDMALHPEARELLLQVLEEWC